LPESSLFRHHDTSLPFLLVHHPNIQSSCRATKNISKTAFSHLGTSQLIASFTPKHVMEGKRKTFSENKTINLLIAKYGKTQTSNVSIKLSLHNSRAQDDAASES
jgi:hypothetical protein